MLNALEHKNILLQILKDIYSEKKYWQNALLRRKKWKNVTFFWVWVNF